MPGHEASIELASDSAEAKVHHMGLTRVTFVGAGGAAAAAAGSDEWQIDRVVAVRGESLPPARVLERVESSDNDTPPPAGGVWSLRGVRSNDRYVERGEKDRLAAIQPGLGRADSRVAALVPIRKSEAWWNLAQDERRALFETTSRHIAIGLQYLPAIARRLYHCRDVGGEPFDFLTWFEFAARDSAAFDELLGRLRATEEWRYVEREVEVRVRRP
ncbi:MAG: chlorite dismutase family protein [Bacteroidota bacterium]